MGKVAGWPTDDSDIVIALVIGIEWLMVTHIWGYCKVSYQGGQQMIVILLYSIGNW